MSNKYYKFHFKNDKEGKSSSCNVDLNNFSEALEFAYNRLDELNQDRIGYRIIGIYEILSERNSFVPSDKTN